MFSQFDNFLTYFTFVNIGAILLLVNFKKFSFYDLIATPFLGLIVVNFIGHNLIYLSGISSNYYFLIKCFLVIASIITLIRIKSYITVLKNLAFTVFLLLFVNLGYAIFVTYDSFKIIMHSQMINTGNINLMSIKEVLSWGSATPALYSFASINSGYILETTFPFFLSTSSILILISIISRIYLSISINRNYFLYNNLMLFFVILIFFLIPWSRIHIYYISDHFLFATNLVVYSFFVGVLVHSKYNARPLMIFTTLMMISFFGITLRFESWIFFFTCGIYLLSFFARHSFTQKLLLLIFFSFTFLFFNILSGLNLLGDIIDIGEITVDEYDISKLIYFQLSLTVICLLFFILLSTIPKSTQMLIQFFNFEKLSSHAFVYFIIFLAGYFSLFSVSRLLNSIYSIIYLLFVGGGWGLFWIFYFIAVFFILLFGRYQKNIYFNILTLYIVITFSIVLFGNQAFSHLYPFGSFNRMAFHFVPLGLISFYCFIGDTLNKNTKTKAP